MKVTGYMLREALKRWQLKRDSAVALFESSLKKFDDETKDPPALVMRAFMDAERAIAQIQAAQATYNGLIKVTVQDTVMSLNAAVKMLGGASRREKLWRDVATPSRSAYGYNDGVRSKDQEVAKPTITQKDAAALAVEAGKYTSALRAAIAVANGNEVDLDISAGLLE